MADCPDCKHELIENDIALICPNCDFLTMKKLDWKGDSTKCPKCGSSAKVFKHSKPGKSFVCGECNTVGRYFDEKKLTKVVKKDSKEGKNLTWLFEVPCEYWTKKELVEKTICKDCEMRDVCDAHLEEIEKFCKKKNVEIYMHKDYIEIVHE